MRSIAAANRFYRKANKKYFGGKLPPVQIFYKRMKLIAQVRYDRKWKPTRILLNVRLKIWPSVCAMSLLHEMAHIDLVYVQGDTRTYHGPPWGRIMRRLAREGAFDNLW